MVRSSFRANLASTLFALASISVVGCGPSGPARAKIEGRVTVGGAPLKAGKILFVPVPPAEGPATTAAIVDGEYKLPQQEGPVVGTNRVEVEAELPLGFAMDDEASFAKRGGKLPRQPIAPQYNRQSELSVEVKSHENNRYDIKIPASRPASRNVAY